MQLPLLLTLSAYIPVGDETGKQGCSVEYAESLLVSSPKPGQMTLYKTNEHIPGDAENWGGEELLDWYHDVA
jgi:hypothetical protein